MSAPPEPTEPAPPPDAAVYARRSLFTAAFFIWIAVCLLCIGGGWAVARFGPQLMPLPKSAPAAPTGPPMPQEPR
jgi:hypothetical protein